jgi:hypothetical protein
MAGPWYVDDGGDGTTEDSWATADTSINNLDAEKTFASGEIVYFGHDMQCQATNSANLTITGPSSGAPVIFISATQGSDPVTYQASTTKQIDTTEGAYHIIVSGAFAWYGMSVAAGGRVYFSTDRDENQYHEACRFALGADGFLFLTVGGSDIELVNCVVDLTSDGTTNRSQPIWYTNTNLKFTARGLSFVNSGYRTGVVFYSESQVSNINISGCDFSGLASTCELFEFPNGSKAVGSNCITAATWTPVGGSIRAAHEVDLVNFGPADAPTYIYHQDYAGTTVSSSAIYRTGGATVEGDACGWLVTTVAGCAEGNPHYSPWIYGEVSSTGSKTFTVYITNDTADFTDAQVWLEVEYLGTADEANTTLASDHRTITTTAANQTDDTTSTWNGTGPSFTYKQSLAVTATVNETGQYRARVCVGVASIAGSRYFYIDPKVTVS